MVAKRLSDFTNVDKSADPRSFVEHLSRGSRLEYHRKVKARCLELLDVKPGDAILDVGCGIGDTLSEIARITGTTGRAVGVDPSEAMLVEARKRAAEAGLTAHYVQGDAYRLPFPDNTFDATQALKVFVHLQDPQKAFEEMYRVTKPGGRVLIFEMDAETMLVNAPDREVTRKVLGYLASHFANGAAGRHLYRMMKEKGMADVKVNPETLVLYNLETAEPYWTFRSTAQRCVEAGLITAEQAASWVASIEEIDRAGNFFNSLTAFIVCGQKPLN